MATAPAGFDEAEVELMVRKYRDPERKGLVNYRNLHHDIVALSDIMVKEGALVMPDRCDVTDYLTPAVSNSSTITKLLGLPPSVFYKLKKDQWLHFCVVHFSLGGGPHSSTDL